MKRNFLFDCYQSPRGKLLRDMEIDYLQRNITVSCQQIVLQIGSLGFENEFIDSSLYKDFIVLDGKGSGCEDVKKIRAQAHSLPLKTDSVDMIIVPHLLEFDNYRFETLREIERVLKPEGLLLILNFNPWSLSVRYQYILNKKMADSWSGHFISKARIMDWLKLLNFDIIMSTDFNVDSTKSTHGNAITRGNSLFTTAYAIKALKRRFTLIPLTSVENLSSRLVLVDSLNPTTQLTEYE